MYDDVYKTRRGFITPSEHIPSDDDMKRYAESDETVVNFLVESLMGYIVNSVEWFLRYSESAKPFEEDCISESLLALNTFVRDNLGRQYKPQHFMNSAKLHCLSSVKDWLREMSITVTVPARTAQRHNIVMVKHKLTGREQTTSENYVFDRVWYDQFLDMLDDFDRRLVELRVAGHSDRAIGNLVGLERDHVKNHMTRLANLYLGE